jgi:hypothetical protein
LIDDRKPTISVPHGYVLLCGQPLNVPCGLWFAPLGVLRPSVRFAFAFAPLTVPVVQVLSLKPLAAVHVSAPSRWLSSGGEMPWACGFDRLGRRAWHCAESSRKPYLFLVAEG